MEELGGCCCALVRENTGVSGLGFFPGPSPISRRFLGPCGRSADRVSREHYQRQMAWVKSDVSTNDSAGNSSTTSCWGAHVQTSDSLSFDWADSKFCTEILYCVTTPHRTSWLS